MKLNKQIETEVVIEDGYYNYASQEYWKVINDKVVEHFYKILDMATFTKDTTGLGYFSANKLAEAVGILEDEYITARRDLLQELLK